MKDEKYDSFNVLAAEMFSHKKTAIKYYMEGLLKDNIWERIPYFDVVKDKTKPFDYTGLNEVTEKIVQVARPEAKIIIFSEDAKSLVYSQLYSCSMVVPEYHSKLIRELTLEERRSLTADVLRELSGKKQNE